MTPDRKVPPARSTSYKTDRRQANDGTEGEDTSSDIQETSLLAPTLSKHTRTCNSVALVDLQTKENK
jgi:hypothetical protein